MNRSAGSLWTWLLETFRFPYLLKRSPSLCRGWRRCNVTNNSHTPVWWRVDEAEVPTSYLDERMMRGESMKAYQVAGCLPIFWWYFVMRIKGLLDSVAGFLGALVILMFSSQLRTFLAIAKDGSPSQGASTERYVDGFGVLHGRFGGKKLFFSLWDMKQLWWERFERWLEGQFDSCLNWNILIDSDWNQKQERMTFWTCYCRDNKGSHYSSS